MDSARGCIGTLAMLFFGAIVLIGWIIMVILPVLAGEPPAANIGSLVAYTVGSLIVWRVAGGPGWGLAPESSTTQPAASGVATAGYSGDSDGLLPDDWCSALARRGLGSDELRDILTHAYRPGSWPTSETLPERRQVFRAFNLTPLHKVKVVVIGQDPYPSRGIADGLAFSAQPGVPLPHSLERVFSNLESDSALQFSRPDGGDLAPWAQQGVLLLNSALTVLENSPGSQSSIWEPFTRSVLETVNEKFDPVVFLLWGDNANKLADEVPINEGRHRVIRSTHPRREEASRYPRFANTHPFSEANRFLRSHGRDEVDWSL